MTILLGGKAPVNRQLTPKFETIELQQYCNAKHTEQQSQLQHQKRVLLEIGSFPRRWRIGEAEHDAIGAKQKIRQRQHC